MVRHSPLYTDYQVEVYQALCITFPILVGLSTIARLYIKGREKWWWDDLWVTIGTCIMIEQQAVLWSLSMYQLPTLPVGIVVVISSNSQVWAARASLLASVLRIAPNSKARWIARSAGALFVVFYLITVAQAFWLCGPSLQIKDGRPQCLLTKQIPAYQFAAAMVSDLILIALPLHTLRLLQAESGLRRRLRLVFAASAVTTCCSLALALTNFLDDEFGLFIAAEMECWISLLVCNVGILLVPIFRRFSSTPDKSQFTHSGSGGTRIGTHRGTKSNPIEISVVHFASSTCDPETNIEMGKVNDLKQDQDSPIGNNYNNFEHDLFTLREGNGGKINLANAV